MRFLVSVVDDTTGSGTSDELEAIDAFNGRLKEDGHWILACGLASPATAKVIDNRAGEAVVTDGPLVDSTEYVSGFWLIDAPDPDTALGLAAEGSKACNRRVEVRALLG